MSLKKETINKEWTLFLDRDGVINKRLDNDYVKTIDEFEFLPEVKQAINLFSNRFGRIIVVTNQQGIGKGLYTTDDLNKIHAYMKQEVVAAGGRIDGIYYSPYLHQENHPTRKPNTGMAEMAKHDFPEISFEKCIMAGDSLTDMEFGRKLGMKTIFIGDFTKENGDKSLIDLEFRSLKEFADFLSGNN